MPAGPADIGITSSSGLLMQNLEWEIGTTVVSRKNAAGGFGVAHAVDPIISGTLKMLGTSGVDLGVAAAGIDDVVDGVTVFNEKTHTQFQDNYDETDLAFSNAPDAEVGAAA